MSHPWLAQRADQFDSSGIRKVFDLAAKMSNPINLSIGQPDFPVPDAVKQAAIEAIQAERNGYSVTQGIAPLREALQSRVDREYGHGDRRVLVTSGTSGGLVLALMVLVDPGDEVIVFDPHFVMYPPLVGMVGGRTVLVDTYPDFQIDVHRVAAAITPRTKLILLNSPANPTGVVASSDRVRELAELAAARNVALLSDEIYSQFCYDGALPKPAAFNKDVLVVDGFGKAYGVTGWRLGWVHGPSAIVEKMTMLQQYSFVCAPHPLQWGALRALDVDMSEPTARFARRRDLVVDGLRAAGYAVTQAGGAFYVFPEVPPGRGSAQEFVARAIANELLVIPGGIFSRHDTHFRISFAADERQLERGLDVLARLNRD